MLTAPELWWILSAVSVAFIIGDWHHAPIDPTMHIGFLLITAAMGPLGAFTYVLTVREPLPHTHAEYIAPRWKQVVGSTYHCVAGDSIGIVGAAVLFRSIAGVNGSMWLNLALEYTTGFLAGWLVFQSVFMKDMVGGSYQKAVYQMFLPEWLSMNGVMAGMIAIMVPWMRVHPSASLPSHPGFWFMMSIALIAGAVVAYPINWWLVAANLKHGIISTAAGHGQHSMSSGLTYGDKVQMGDHMANATPEASRQRTKTLVPIALWSMGLLGLAAAITMW